MIKYFRALFSIFIMALAKGSVTFAMPIGSCNHNSLLHNVLWVGEVDQRRVLNDEDRHRYAATGKVECINLSGDIKYASTVNVVNNQDSPSKVALAAAHTFYDKQTCQRYDIKKCQVYFPNSNDKRVFNIKSLDGECPYESGDLNFNKDKVIIEIDRVVPGAKAYDIPKIGSPSITPVLDVITVAAGSRDLVVNGDKPFHIEACQIRDRNLRPDVPLQTTCHTDHRASGAAQVFDDNASRPLMLAMHVGGIDNSVWNSREYHPKYRFNVSVPLEGELLTKIHEKLQQVASRRPSRRR